MRQEELQQVELGGGQRQFAVAHEYTRRALRSRRNGPISQSRRLGVHLLAPQVRLHPRHQFARAERLGHVIVAADFEAQHAVHFVRARGQEQHRGARQHRRLANLAAQLETVHFRAA